MDDRARVRAWFGKHGARFGLDPTRVGCAAVFNPGGFVNRSFTVSDGRRQVHVKLVAEAGVEGLRRWAAVHGHLEAVHHCPPLLGLVQGGAMAGEAAAAIFEHIPGRALAAVRDGAVLRQVLGHLPALQRDGVLASGLPAAAGRTCADELADTFILRLRADLGGMAPELGGLPFVPAGFAAWAEAEVSGLERSVRSCAAMAEPAADVVHGDLHGDNVRLGEGGRWWLLDWDDLHGGGDGLLDAACLLWPLLRDGRGVSWGREWAASAGEGAAARLEWYERALLLDEVVDSLADWLEAAGRPDQRDAARALKQVAHREALVAYRQRFGRGPAG